jgi:hypothetical protein
MDSKTRVGIVVGILAAVGAAAWLLRRAGDADRTEGDDVARQGPVAPPAPPVLHGSGEGTKGTKPPEPRPSTAGPKDEPPRREPQAPGREVRGRVVDEWGKPLAGVAVRLTRSPWREDTDRGFRPYRTAPLGPAPAGAEATTDADGRYVLRGEGDRVVSASPAWWFDVAAASGGAIRARPGLLLVATVTDAVTGRPVEKFGGHARSDRAGVYVPFDGEDGRVEIRSERRQGLDEAVVVDLAVEASDYVPVQVPVAFPRGESTAEVALRLAPVAPDEKARLTVEVLDSTERPFDGDWVVRIVDPRDSTQTIQEFGIVEREGPGLYAASLPPGRWNVLVKANDWLGFLRRTQEVDLVPGPNRLRCVMPPHGALVVRWPGRWETKAPGHDPHLAVYPTDGGEGSGVGNLAGKTEYRTATCLEGDWRIQVQGPRETLTKDARVRAGEETVVDFGQH